MIREGRLGCSSDAKMGEWNGPSIRLEFKSVREAIDGSLKQCPPSVKLVWASGADD